MIHKSKKKAKNNSSTDKMIIYIQLTRYSFQQERKKSLSVNCCGAQNFSQFLPCVLTTTVIPFVKHSTHAAV